MCGCPCCKDLRDLYACQRLMRHVPVHLFEQIHERLLLPLLTGISHLVPILFPLQWTHSPSLCERTGDSLRSEYHCLCWMVYSWRSLVSDGRVDAVRLIYTLSSRADNLLSWLTQRRRWLFGVISEWDARVIRLRSQIKQIKGVDAVFSKIYREVLAIVHRMRDPLSIEVMGHFAMSCGAVDRMRTLAVELRVKFRSRSAVRYLTGLETALAGAQSMEYDRLIAVAMAMHPRLGALSPLACVGRDLLPHCVPRLMEEPLLGWRDVVNVAGAGLL